jgi:hypothetical protein
MWGMALKVCVTHAGPLHCYLWLQPQEGFSNPLFMSFPVYQSWSMLIKATWLPEEMPENSQVVCLPGWFPLAFWHLLPARQLWCADIGSCNFIASLKEMAMDDPEQLSGITLQQAVALIGTFLLC